MLWVISNVPHILSEEEKIIIPLSGRNQLGLKRGIVFFFIVERDCNLRRCATDGDSWFLGWNSDDTGNSEHWVVLFPSFLKSILDSKPLVQARRQGLGSCPKQHKKRWKWKSSYYDRITEKSILHCFGSRWTIVHTVLMSYAAASTSSIETLNAIEHIAGCVSEIIALPTTTSCVAWVPVGHNIWKVVYQKILISHVCIN